MHTKSDFWKWIKIMKFGQNCETLSKLKELLVFPICLFFLFKFTLNIDKPEYTPIDDKSQRKFMAFTILGGDGPACHGAFRSSIAKCTTDPGIECYTQSNFNFIIMIQFHWCLQNGDFYNQLWIAAQESECL